MSHMSSLFRVASCQSGSFFGRFDSDHLREPVHYGLNHGEEMCLAEKGSSYLEGNAGPVDSMHFFAWHCLHFVNPWKRFFFGFLLVVHIKMVWFFNHTFNWFCGVYIGVYIVFGHSSSQPPAPSVFLFFFSFYLQTCSCVFCTIRPTQQESYLRDEFFPKACVKLKER